MTVDPLQVQHAEAVKVFVILNAFISGPLNPYLAGSVLPTAILVMRKRFFVNLPLAQPRQNAQVSLKTYEIFIYGDVHYVTNSNCKKVPTQRHLSLGCELYFYAFFLLLSVYSTELDVRRTQK